jgi:hypothetical protein
VRTACWQDAERLADDAAEAVALRLRHDRVVGVAAGDDGLDVGIQFAQPPQRFEAAHAAGDREVEDHRVEASALPERLGIEIHRVASVAGGDDVVPEFLQQAPADGPDGDLVLQQQHRAVAARRRRGIVIHRRHRLARRG